MQYVIYLTNPDDQAEAIGVSYTSGRYGFTVRAESMTRAIEAVIARSQRDGFYGRDWSAKIIQLDERGRVPPLSWMSETIIQLRDAGETA